MVRRLGRPAAGGRSTPATPTLQSLLMIDRTAAIGRLLPFPEPITRGAWSISKSAQISPGWGTSPVLGPALGDRIKQLNRSSLRDHGALFQGMTLVAAERMALLQRADTVRARQHVHQILRADVAIPHSDQAD